MRKNEQGKNYIKQDVYNDGQGGVEFLESKITMMVEDERTEGRRGKGLICGN